MNLNPAQLPGQLARGLAGCYAIAGEEPLLIVESLDAVRTAARKAGYSERESLDADKNFEWQQLADSCASGSLFAERRLVEVRIESGPGAAGGAMLAQLAASVPSDVLLIVTAGRLDKHARNSKWWAAFERHGASVYAWPVRSEEFPAWLAGRLRVAGFSPTPAALALLAQRTEGNLLAASQEIMKLGLLQKPGPLDVDAVASAVADSAHFEIYDWLDRVWAGDGAAAVRGLQCLREEDEQLPPIVGALASDLRTMFAVALEVSRGASPAEAAKVAFFKRQAGFARAAGRLRTAQILRWLRQCGTIDLAAKSGSQPQAWEELLTLTLAASGAAKSGAGAARR